LESLDFSSLNSGSAQQSLNRNYVYMVPVKHFPLPIQRRIAGILSAYDDLIENSQRRIKILEEVARRLYREWFVHFRFPGHEGCRFVESPLGEIPEGWEVKRLGDVTTKIGSGATPKGGKGAYKTEGIHLIRSLNIYDYSFQFDNLACIDEDQAAGLDNVRVQQNDVLLNITGASVARCAMVPSYLLPARVNQHVAIIRADEAKVSPHYLLDAINSDFHKQKLLSYAQGGATREALTKETISGFEIVVPPTLVMSRYAGVASGIHLHRETLTRQIQNLRRTRDLLLPRLLSGQIDVEALPEPALQEVG
jgi:type I restriction enzyme S subunit